MVKFSISKALFDKFPKLEVGVLVIKGFDNSKVDSNVIDKVRAEEKKIRENLEKNKLSELESIKVWREAYSSFGAKPKKYKASVEALLRRVLESEDLPSINKLVDTYNYISIKYKLPLGADDLDKAKEDLLLTYANGDESFVAINSEEKKNPEMGEVVYKSGKDVLCRKWNWRESELTKIDENSKDIIIYCESLTGNNDLENAMKELQDSLGGNSFVLTANKNSLDIDNLKLNNDDYSEYFENSKVTAQKSEENKSKENKKDKKEPKKDRKEEESMHWADQTARKIIQVKGDKKEYVCASGITPSGIVHIGNFREIITVELVVRALKEAGKKVRFIYSWDDYDVFRKVPKDWPKQEELKKELRKPIVDVFDPFNEEDSFARHNEIAVEKQLPILGINPEFIYQAKQNRKCAYKDGIKKALQNADKIKEILNEYRKEPLDENWLPISIFDKDLGTDEVSDIKYLGDYSVSYKDNNGKEKTFDFSKDGRSKLLWRVDWPMRWAEEKVDFEPGGKDHSTQGGSYTTGRKIAKEVYNFDAPLYIMYDFISIKGAGGKISSSLGNVITIKEVLEIYEPDIVRYLFAGTRPNTEFAISFDLDVIKIYEDFDKLERTYYGKENVSDKMMAKQKRIYELSSVNKPLKKMPLQPSFRHLTNIMQIYEYDFKKVKEFYKENIKDDSDLERLKVRYDCAKNWVENYAPEDMKFNINEKVEMKFNDNEKKLLVVLREKLKAKEYKEEELYNELYSIINANDSNSKEFFKACYTALIGKEKGPKLAGFILEIGQKRVVKILEKL